MFWFVVRMDAACVPSAGNALMTGSSPLPSPAASGPTIKPDAEAERPLPPPCQTPSTAGLAAAAACAAEAEDDLDNSSSSPSYLVVLCTHVSFLKNVTQVIGTGYCAVLL